MEYANASEEQKIEYLDNIICASHNNMVDYYNNYIRLNKSSKKVMTLDEYVKMLHEDEHFKIILACSNLKTLNKIYFWIFFWSAWTIVSSIILVIYFLKNGGIL